MKAWSNLPNAHHIDRVLESVKSHTESWDEAWVAFKDATRLAARDAASLAALNAARDSTLDAARVAAWNEVKSAASDAARDAASLAALNAALSATWDAAWIAITVLIAWDDASKYLDMPSDKLRVWAILSEDPAAVLLIPAVIAFEKIAKKEKQLLTI